MGYAHISIRLLSFVRLDINEVGLSQPSTQVVPSDYLPRLVTSNSLCHFVYVHFALTLDELIEARPVRVLTKLCTLQLYFAPKKYPVSKSVRR